MEGGRYHYAITVGDNPIRPSQICPVMMEATYNVGQVGGLVTHAISNDLS